MISGAADLKDWANPFRNGFTFPPNLDQVWGAKHVNDLKSYFQDNRECQIQCQRIGYRIHPILTQFFDIVFGIHDDPKKIKI